MIPKSRICIRALGLSVFLASGAAALDDDEKKAKDDGKRDELPVVGEEASPWEFLLKRHDKDGDGKISQAEYGRSEEAWARLDRDGDGVLVEGELSTKWDRRGGGRTARPEPPKVGEFAPVFSLTLLPPGEMGGHGEDTPEEQPDAKKGESKGKKSEAKKPEEPESVSLVSFRGEKPVALIFGSYT